MNSLEAGEAAAESQDTSHMARRFPLISLVLLALLALVPAASAREFASPHEHGAEAGPAESPEAALRKAHALSEGRGIRTGRELTPALKELAAAYDELSPADRRRARRLLARPTMG